MPFLGLDRSNKPYQAWKVSYKCSGIRYCEFADKRILGMDPAYDDVDLKSVFDLHKESIRLRSNRTIPELIRDQILQLYHSFMRTEWLANKFTCKNSLVCTKQERPQTWERNRVSITLAYAQHMLTIC